MPAISQATRMPQRTQLSTVVRVLAIAVVCSQSLIAVTGSIVRVSGSGLGCPTWPRCFPGSMFPVSHPEVATLHQVIEFGNRILAPIIGLIAAACLVTAWFSRPRRRRLVLLALTMPLGVVVQAVIGGITVRMQLEWWTVAVHFLASAPLIWLATVLVAAAREGDETPRWLIPPGTRRVLFALPPVLAAVLIAGTLVTAAGPHAGDAATARLQLPIATLVQVHGALLVVFLGLLVYFGVSLSSVNHADNNSGTAAPRLRRAYGIVIAVVLGQGVLGSLQYLLQVPAALVVLHILGATLVIISTANLWSASRERGALPG